MIFGSVKLQHIIAVAPSVQANIHEAWTSIEKDEITQIHLILIDKMEFAIESAIYQLPATSILLIGTAI